MTSVRQAVLEQARRNGDDLATISTQLARVEDKLDRLYEKLGAPDGKFDDLTDKLDAFITNLPVILRDVVCGIFREWDERQLHPGHGGKSGDR